MSYFDNIHEGFSLVCDAIGGILVAIAMVAVMAGMGLFYTFGAPFWLVSKFAARQRRKEEEELIKQFEEWKNA